LTLRDNQPQTNFLRPKSNAAIINMPRRHLAILIVAKLSSRLSRYRLRQIVFWSQDGLPRCRVLGPTKLIFGQPFEVRRPAEGSSLVPLALTVGMQFAKDVAVPLVIWDPEGLWEDSWGTLSDRNAITPGRAGATTECSPGPLATSVHATTQ